MTDVVEGSTSYHDYSFTDADGAAVTSVEALEYKLLSQSNVLVDWTAIADLSPPGVIEISGALNTKSNPRDVLRYLTVRVTHDGGSKIVKEISYSLIEAKGVP